MTKINQQLVILPAAFSEFNLTKDRVYNYFGSNYKFYVGVADIIENKKTDLKHNLEDYKTVNKGFILNVCDYSKEKIKECAKLRNIKITNKLEDADFIIGPGFINKKVFHNDNLRQRSMYFNGRIKINNNNMFICSTTGWNINNEWGRVYSITLINMMYRYFYEDLKLVSCIDFCNVGTEITADIIDQMKYNIKNEAYDLVNELLPRMIFTKEYIRWYAGKYLFSYYYRTKSKKVRNWMKVNNLHSNYKMSAMEKLSSLQRKDKLDNESFQFLEKEIRQNILIIDGDIYDFKATLKPEYRKYYGKEIKNNRNS
jgi:hypothetical protein